MTTIVAAAADGRVVIAADSLTNVYDRPIYGGARKIRRVKIGNTGGRGEALLAFCGCGGLVGAAEAIKIADEPDADNPEDVERWANTIAHAINDWARDVGLSDNGRTDGSILLAWRGRIWTMSEVWAIPHPDGRAALGSGEGPAIGALDVLLDINTPLDVAVTHACEIGVSRDKHSGGPIQVEALR